LPYEPLIITCMNAITPWAAAASDVLSDKDLPCYYTNENNKFNFKVHCTNDSLWMLVDFPANGQIAFRMAYSPDNEIKIEGTTETETGVNVKLSSVIGDYVVKVDLPRGDNAILRYTTTLTPRTAMFIPFWPRDIIIPGKNGQAEKTAGTIYVSQVGTRSGQIYFSATRPKAGSVLYLQNLTALQDYNQQTETSAGETVGGQWPELGFALPPATQKPLEGGKEIIISDAVVVFNEEVPADEPAIIEQYLNMLATAYMQLPKPETKYHHWPDILEKSLHDLIDSPGCWAQVAGHHYFNAYVSDYATPPEIMVQLAVLLPLLDYAEWSGRSLEVMNTIKEGLPSFYNKELGTIMRWLPAAEDKLEGEEEQKEPLTMDSWYLHHPMLNLSRLALKGDKVAKQLFLDSLEYTINVAHHFKYQWPVFYKMDTLKVLKEETQPGKGGEKDVPGLYAHVMLQAYELTGKKRYLDEAEKAAKKLQGLGFDVFYQANNTTFSAGALLRLYKITGNKLYLDLSNMCLASIFINVRLWDCNYGYGKHFPSFFCLFPLNDAPYTAVYEEQEVYCALHDYLVHAQDVDILPSVKLLIAEYIRNLVGRAVYYYPPALPKEMLSEDVKVGELDPKLWIALEDLYDGWEQAGQVGQEVYGAGNAFGILPRQYMRVPDESFMIFIDYPTEGFIAKKGKPVSFNVLGDSRLTCRLLIINMDNNVLPEFDVTLGNSKDILKGKKTREGHIEFIINGNQQVNISWKEQNN